MGPTEKRYPVGGIVFFALGFLLVAISLLVPWMSTTSLIDSREQVESVGAFGFGVSSVLYLIGVLALLASLGAVVALWEPLRQIGGMCGIAVSALPVLAVALVNRDIHAAVVLTEEREAELIRDGASPDSVMLWTAMDAGPMLASLGAFALAVAVCRFAWPSRPTLCYAGAAIAAAAVGAAVPWSYQKTTAGEGGLQQYWFPSFGAAGLSFAVSLTIAMGALLLAGMLERRAWWPAILAAPATAAAMVVIGIAESRAVRGDLVPDDAVVNTGLPLIWLLASLVLTICAEVMAVRTYRAARRWRAPVSPTPAPAIR